MRLIQTCSGLLSIIGAAFLFATVHAMVREPVNLAPPPIKAGAGDVTPRVQPNGTPDEGEAPVPVVEPVDEPTEQPDQPGLPDDAMLDAPVPEGTLTLRESYSLFQQDVYFIDARHEHEYEAGHIEYAFWLPSTLFDTDSDRAFAVVDSMPPDATVVIYCVGGDCDASKNTARRLSQIGFTDLRIMGVGYGDWVDAGFPITEGSEP
ncbi:MAG: rhodanese-like domain-containing protein [Phycisphaerales bacterium JB052]